MPRYNKIPKVKGPKRVVMVRGEPEIRQTYFCGECGKRLKVSAAQKPYTITAMVCDDIYLHKNGKIFLWPSENVQIH